jgi:hypothetical protein
LVGERPGTPTLSTAGVAGNSADLVRLHEIAAIAVNTTADAIPIPSCPSRRISTPLAHPYFSTPLPHSYFLFIGGSSTNWTQKPLGLTFEAFLTILIFI